MERWSAGAYRRVCRGKRDVYIAYVTDYWTGGGN